MKGNLVLIIFLILSGINLYSENKVKSPVINSNGTVTFNLEYPVLDQVYLRGSFVPPKRKFKTPAGTFSMSGKVEMKRDGNTWTYTTDSLSSEFYTYSFEVEDKAFIDPNNKNIVRDISDNLNYFIIGNGIADDYIEQNVPHGKVEYVWYPSKLNEMQERRMAVYLPYEYFKNPNKQFPVLYLLHGSGGDEEAWNNCGRISQIMDNLISDKRCKPMIVVMPNGNSNLRAAPGADPENPGLKSSSINTESMLGEIESVFVDDIITFIDKNYRTIDSKDSRAIAGLSLGGLHTLFVSANNPEIFDYVGLFSAQTTNALNNESIKSMQKIGETWNEITNFLPFLKGRGLDEKISKYSSNTLNIYSNLDDKLAAQFKNPPQLYYIAVGKDDFVKKLNDDFRKKLDNANYSYYYKETDGGHTWENWRKYLVDFLPHLFQE